MTRSMGVCARAAGEGGEANGVESSGEAVGQGERARGMR